MALSLIDRLLGRTETTALAVVEPPEIKAVTGPGAFAMTYHTPLHSFSRDPNRLMAEAEALFHTNGWVGAAERALGGRFIRMAWHLEDEQGDTIDEKSPEPLQEPLRLLQRPSEDKTRRQVMSVTFRHTGLAGNGAWFLDQRDALAGRPLQVIYINPARLTPALDPAGNIKGWVLDDPNNMAVAQRSREWREGVPLSVDEVIHFTLDEPDWGIWGIGWPESAQRKIELDKLTESHSGGILASGGRLAGLITPKAQSTISDDQWVQFARDWRSITSDPDAAKRLQIAKMPLDFTQMTASPKDLQLIDLTRQNRDDILAMAGVPLSQLGINVPAGLNADRSESDDAAIWETIKQRAEPIRETIQVKLLDRWQAVGIKVTLVFEYPEFDDDTPRYEAAAKSVNVAITNDERRAILGLEPLEDEELGRAVFVDSRLVRIDAPEPEPPSVPTVEEQSLAEPTEEEAESVQGKADLRKPLLGLRAETEVTWEPKVRAVVARVLRQQEQFVVSKLDHAVRKNDLSWWNESRENRRFTDALEPLMADMAREVAGKTTRTVKKPEGKADTFTERVLDLVRSAVGQRITGINRTTRDKVQAAIAAGVEAGESPADIGKRIQDSAAFDEYRAELVSRTETAQVYNDAALHSYSALEVTEVDAIDGDTDAECAARNGKRYLIEEAMGISDHPNGTLDWIPVVKAGVQEATSVTPEDLALIQRTIAEAFAKANLSGGGGTAPALNFYLPNDVRLPVPEVTVNVPPQAAPVVNYTPPKQPPPNVTINVPESTVSAKATLPAEVKVVSMPNRVHHAIRSKDGLVEGSMEGDA